MRMDMDRTEIAWEWEELDETDSTNRVALGRVMERWGAGRSAAGIVVTARRQTSGRGQHGRRWESPAGGLYLSAVLQDVPVALRERLALAVGVCVVEAVESLGAKGLLIRWPNDVVVASGDGLLKLGGILCEAVAQGDRWAVVVGVGVNVAGADLPPVLGATSLEALGVGAVPREVGEAIAARLGTLVGFSLGDVIAQVRQRDALRGRGVRLHDAGVVTEGVGGGIDDTGRLVVDLGGGVARAFERGRLHGYS